MSVQIELLPGKDYTLVYESDTDYLVNNFTAKEVSKWFFKKEYNKGAAMPISFDVLTALQMIRDKYGVPMYVTSATRNYIPTGGSTNSAHMKGVAIDFKFLQDNNTLIKKLMKEQEQKTPFFCSLVAAGLRGIGFYDTFVHIDTWEPTPDKRQSRINCNGIETRFGVWNKRTEGPADILNILDQTDEDGHAAKNAFLRPFLGWSGVAAALVWGLYMTYAAGKRGK